MGRTRRAATAALVAVVAATTATGLAFSGTANAASGAEPVTTAASPAAVTAPAEIAGLRAQLRSTGLAGQHGVSAMCKDNHLACQAQVVTVAPGSSTKLITGAPVGYGATELAKAYGLANAHGSNATIALAGTGAYPNLESDLNIYRDTYGLPRCTTANGCLKVVSYYGGPPKPPATTPLGQLVEELVAVETALDVQMASAACPTCKIVFTQLPWQDALLSDDAGTIRAAKHFATATNTARRLGASAVSISYGYPTLPTTLFGDPAQRMRQPGVAVFSSSGDSGFLGNLGQWPQSLPTVISAGGTSLYQSPGTRGYADVAWAGAGSGCTPGVRPANGQPASVSKACNGSRAASDISAVADPNTGVAVYDSYSPAFGQPYGFLVVGGTSAASPFLAGVAARTGVPSRLLGPNLLYGASSGGITDVVIGQNAAPGVCQANFFDPRLCVAGRGWDGPTGVGVPNGLLPFGNKG